MKEPIDMITIMAGFVSREAESALHYLLEVGPSATVAEVCAVAERYKNALSQKRPLSLLEAVGYSATSVEGVLRCFSMLGVLAEQEGRFSLTQRAIDHFCIAIAMGCSDAEYATAPAWIRALIECEEVPA